MTIMAARAGNEYRQAQDEFNKLRNALRDRWTRNEIEQDLFEYELKLIEHAYQQRIQALDRRNMARRASDLGIGNGNIAARQYADDYIRYEYAPEPLLHPLHDADTSDPHAVEQGELIMNILKTKVIGVKFLGNGNSEAAGFEKLYHYFTDDMSIKKDDYCIVIGASGAPTMVKVYEESVISKNATKMIVGKVDLEAYNEKMKVLVARSAALKRLKEIEEEQTAQEKYKHLAAKSDEAAELLKLLGYLDDNGATAIGTDKTIDGEVATSDPTVG